MNLSLLFFFFISYSFSSTTRTISKTMPTIIMVLTRTIIQWFDRETYNFYFNFHSILTHFFIFASNIHETYEGPEIFASFFFSYDNVLLNGLFLSSVNKKKNVHTINLTHLYDDENRWKKTELMGYIKTFVYLNEHYIKKKTVLTKL